MLSRHNPLRSRWRTLAFLCALAAPACAEDAGQVQEEQPPSVAVDEEALRIGDSGHEVEHVNRYFARFGYFPNAELAREQPLWHPIVLQAPADESVFDENTELAVRAFQRRLHLDETGMVDAATRAAMNIPRCGVPDSAAVGDDKWALFGATWGTNALTYSVNTAGTPENRGSVFLTQVNTAFASWTARSGYTATRVANGGNIQISWTDLGGSAATGFVLGSAAPTINGSNVVTGYTLRFNNNAGLSWSFADEPSVATDFDIGSVLTHEVGHALRLDHSNPGGPQTPVMFFSIPSGTIRSQLTPDDLAAIHARQPGHFMINAPDGGIPNAVVAGQDGSLWALGSSWDPNGYKIYSRNLDGSWSEHPFGGRAVSIAVLDNGALWRVQADGRMYRAGNGWVSKAGSAYMVAASGSNAWHLSKAVTRGTKDRDLYSWNGGTNNWDKVDGFASDLTLVTNPNASNRVEAWYTNEFGEVFRQIPGQSPTGMPAVPGGACGISGGADGQVYALQCPFNANGMPIYVWNEQVGIDRPGTGSDTPGRNQWTPIPGAARDVTSTRVGWSPTTTSRLVHVGTNGLYSTN